MFGYIRPFKPDMRMAEYDIYKSFYCGLCKSMGNHYGMVSRMTLSYDFAFVSLLHSAINDTQQQFKNEACLFNPFKKKLCCGSCNELSFSTDIAMLMLYHKVRDNIADEKWYKKILYYIVLPFASHFRKKAMKNVPKIDKCLSNMMIKQSQLEEENCASIDMACEPTAQALSVIISSLSQEEADKRVLSSMGYFLGRHIYMCDALDDMEKDIFKKSYNPFVLSSNKPNLTKEDIAKIISETKSSLYMNIAEVIKAYELLNIKRYKNILDNIIYLGLKSTVNQLEFKKEQNI